MNDTAVSLCRKIGTGGDLESILLTDVTQNGVYYYEAVRKVIFVISKEQSD